MLERIVKQILERYGSVVKIRENGKTISAKVFIQPLHYKNKSYFNVKSLPIGRFDNSHYLLIASPNISINNTGGAVIESDGSRYIAKANGCYRALGKKIYVWAVLAACTNTMEDDYDSN